MALSWAHKTTKAQYPTPQPQQFVCSPGDKQTNKPTGKQKKLDTGHNWHTGNEPVQRTKRYLWEFGVLWSKSFQAVWVLRWNPNMVAEFERSWFSRGHLFRLVPYVSVLADYQSPELKHSDSNTDKCW